MWGWERTNHRESEAVQTYFVILSRFSTEAKGNIRVHTFGYVQMEVHVLMQYVSALFFFQVKVECLLIVFKIEINFT